MLLRLYIRNYAIIHELDISFAGGLHVITGETGAGKSILLGALSLILGDRADSSVLQDKKGKSIVEGTFRLPDQEEVHTFFRDNELEEEGDTIVRREIQVSGKSRAFINDTPVNLQQLNRLGALLVDLHQQWDTLQLNRSGFQLDILDALAGNTALRRQYLDKYKDCRAKQQELEALREEAGKNNREADYDQFLFDELEQAAFNPDELETLEKEMQLMEHAEELKSTLSAAAGMMEEDEPAVVPLLRQLQSKLDGVARFHSALSPLVARLQSAYLELQDVAADLQKINEEVSFDEERIAFIQERMDTGYKLLKKHGVRTTNELLAIQESLQEKLRHIRHSEGRIEELEETCRKMWADTGALAGRLTEVRKRQVDPFVKRTNDLLAAVGMKGARIAVDLAKQPLNERGADEVTFLFDANKSGNFQPLSKVASGGELSRLMLCIKSLVARSVSLPTLIFDEIDSGISGEAARRVGAIMKELAEGHQVICITHQPQIAGKAHTHFEVYKENEGGRVLTRIRQLSADERIQAIARMLSGDKPGKAALANAKELMG